MEKKTLILGLGNDILSDDRIGPQLVRDLEPVMASERVRFEIAASGGFEVVENIKGFKKVIIIDAIRTPEGKPGDIHCFIPSDFTETKYLPSFHDIDFLTALKLGKALTQEIPEIHIIAIEIVEDMVFSEDFTPLLREKYGEILGNVSGLIKVIMDNTRN